MAEKKVDYKDQIKPGKLDKIPSWIKIILLKYWVAGATFYFFGMGGAFLWANGDNDRQTISLWLILGLGLGLMMEYVSKPIIRLMRTDFDDTYRFNLINLRGVKSLFLNLLYGFVNTMLTMALSVFLNRLHINLDVLNIADGGAEPFLMGFLFLFVDFWFVFFKRLSIFTYKKIRLKMEFKRRQALLDENDVPVMGDETETVDNDHFLNGDK